MHDSSPVPSVHPGIYYHFKTPDQFYQVLGTALNTETEELMVVYKALYGDHQLFVRPLGMFLEEVDRPEIPYTGPRFVWVRESL